MDAMTVLRRCRRFSDDIEVLTEKIERRRSLIQRMTASYTQTGGHGSGENDRMASFVAETDEIDAQLKDRRRRYDAERITAAQLIESLDIKEAKVIELYYIACMTMSAISAKVGYTEQHVRRIRKGAEIKLMDAGDVLWMMPEWYTD